MITEIKTPQDVKAFAMHLVNNDHLQFHPDDDFESYHYSKNGILSPIYTKEEALILNKLMDDCFKICEKSDIDIYDFMLQIVLEQNEEFTK